MMKKVSFSALPAFQTSRIVRVRSASEMMDSAQLVLFKDQGLVPTNTKAQENADVQASDLTKTVITMAQTGHSTLMPKLAQMSIFWDKATPLINGAYTGQIKEADYKAQLATFAKDINK